MSPRVLLRALRGIAGIAGVALFALAASGCDATSTVGGLDGATTPGDGSVSVGLACTPPSIPYAGLPNEHRCGDHSCFNGAEVVLARGTPECGAGVCMVYHWDEFAAPEEGAQRVMCTCRCADETGRPDPGCECAPGFACTNVTSVGHESLRGFYCVRQ